MTMQFLKKMFRDKEYFKMILIIAIPIVLQNLVASSLNMLDTVMVGKLGEAEIGAVGIGNQVFLLFNVMIIGLSGGCGIFIAQYWGQKDIKNIRRVMGISLISGIIISSVFTVIILLFSTQIVSGFNSDPKVIEYGAIYLKTVSLSYVFTAITFCIGNASRSIERAISPMVVSLFALVCNASLNYIFIFGKLGLPAMGVKGAALGTLISRAFEAVILTLYVIKTNKVFFGKAKALIDFNWTYIKRIYSVVLSVILNDLFWASGMVIYSVIYGRMGTKELAASQIYNTLQNVFTVLALGIANATLVMIGKQIGMGDREKAKRYGYQSAVFGFIIGAILSVGIALSASSIVGIFDVSAEVMYYTEMILYVTAAVFSIRCLNIVMITGVLRGGGDTNHALVVELASMYLVGIPLALLGAFVLKLPVHWVVGLVAIEEISKTILVVRRLRSEKWIQNIS